MKFSRPTLKPILPAGDPSDTDATMRVTSWFGPREVKLANGQILRDFHGALDIGNYHDGDILVAPAPGKIIALGTLALPWSEPTTAFPSGNYGGLMMVIQHAPGVVSIFAHMRMAVGKVGDMLMTGQKVGEVGDTGSAQGQPHVHFGIQAPASRVPGGVAVRATKYGYGLDVDPWPFVTGQAELLEEDDMLPDDMIPLATCVVPGGNNLRKGPSTGTDRYYLDAPRQLTLLGYVNGGGWKVGELSGNKWAIVKGDEVWYVATPLVGDIKPTDALPAVVDTAAIDGAVTAALVALNKNLDVWAAQRPTK